jgi:hypothetical protein
MIRPDDSRIQAISPASFNTSYTNMLHECREMLSLIRHGAANNLSMRKSDTEALSTECQKMEHMIDDPLYNEDTQAAVNAAILPYLTASKRTMVQKRATNTRIENAIKELDAGIAFIGSRLKATIGEDEVYRAAKAKIEAEVESKKRKRLEEVEIEADREVAEEIDKLKTKMLG